MAARAEAERRNIELLLSECGGGLSFSGLAAGTSRCPASTSLRRPPSLIAKISSGTRACVCLFQSEPQSIQAYCQMTFAHHILLPSTARSHTAVRASRPPAHHASFCAAFASSSGLCPILSVVNVHIDSHATVLVRRACSQGVRRYAGIEEAKRRSGRASDARVLPSGE